MPHRVGHKRPLHALGVALRQQRLEVQARINQYDITFNDSQFYGPVELQMKYRWWYPKRHTACRVVPQMTTHLSVVPLVKKNRLLWYPT